jgi:hypothetical protein
MNLDLAQTIALIAHGNGFLQGSKYASPPELSQSNSTFQLVASQRFIREDARLPAAKRDIEVSRNTAGWYEDLRARGAQRLALTIFEIQHTHVPAYIANAFSNFSGWSIEVGFETGQEFWVPRWDAGRRNDPSRRIWEVVYRGVTSSDSAESAPVDLIHANSDLRAAIDEAEAFARRAYVDFWADWFINALSLLDSVDPIPPFHRNLLPKNGYSLRARQTLSAAVQSFVFGGMGSWNDLNFNDEDLQRDYFQVTRNLYKAVMAALVGATNAYDANVGAVTA